MRSDKDNEIGKAEGTQGKQAGETAPTPGKC